MAIDRRHVLAALTLGVAGVTAVILADVLATVFVSITVAYVLTPVYRWFRDRGASPWWASAATSVAAILGAAAVVTPIVMLLWLRSSQVVDLIESFPRSATISAFGFTTTVTAGDLVPYATDFVESLAVDLAAVTPVLSIKITLLGVLVFALLMGQDQAKRALMAVVPAGYHDVVRALGERASTTLFAIYVVQAATAFATFLVAVPVFYALGYTYPLTLATFAGVLQFLPIVGPSVLIGALAVFDLSVGNVVRATLVAVVAGVLVAWVPDPVIRPRLARRTGKLPGSLYFVGFTGGLFSMGIVGIVAGPLIVALLVECVSILADEMDAHDDPMLGDRLDRSGETGEAPSGGDRSSPVASSPDDGDGNVDPAARPADDHPPEAPVDPPDGTEGRADDPE